MTKLTPQELAKRLQPLIRAELAAIAAIDGAIARQEHPEYTMLYHEAKNGHQANAVQLTTILRMAGVDAEEKGGIAARVADLQTRLVQEVSTDATLRAMRKAVEGLLERYHALARELGGVAGRGVTQIADRTDRHWHVLTAHIARRGDGAEAARLPRPLGDYFAGLEARACMRCLLDRPGSRPPLHRSAPHVYLCSACHDEVAAAFPPDLREQMSLWPAELRHSRVLEKALGRPSKEAVKKEALALLSGQKPKPRRPPRTLDGADVKVSAPPDESPARPLGADDVAREGAGPNELAYTDLLFDYRSVRESW